MQQPLHPLYRSKDLTERARETQSRSAEARIRAQHLRAQLAELKRRASALQNLVRNREPRST